MTTSAAFNSRPSLKGGDGWTRIDSRPWTRVGREWDANANGALEGAQMPGSDVFDRVYALVMASGVAS